MALCPSCGTEANETARFCRKCGSRLMAPLQDEIPTQNLPAGAAPPDPAAQRTTGATYMPPVLPETYATPPPSPVFAAPAAAPPKKRSKFLYIALGSMLFFVILIVAGIGAAFWFISRNIPRMPQVSTDGKKTSVSIGDKQIVVDESGEISASEVLGEFAYEDAKVVSSITYGDKGKLVVMETDDPFEDVAEYYKSKIKERRFFSEADQAMVIAFDKGMVTITPEGDKTKISVLMGETIPGIPGLPGIPPIPPPPPPEAPPPVPKR